MLGKFTAAACRGQPDVDFVDNLRALRFVFAGIRPSSARPSWINDSHDVLLYLHSPNGVVIGRVLIVRSGPQVEHTAGGGLWQPNPRISSRGE